MTIAGSQTSLQYDTRIMIAGHALEMPLPLPCCRITVDCTSVSGEPWYGRKTTARIVCLRNDEPNQSRHATTVPLRTQQRAPDTLQPSSGGTRARSADPFATL